MVRKVITPDQQNISIHLPKDYVGKQVEVIAFTNEDYNENSNKAANSSQKGILNFPVTNLKASPNSTFGRDEIYDDDGIIPLSI